jgi:hypothetical protein
MKNQSKELNENHHEVVVSNKLASIEIFVVLLTWPSVGKSIPISALEIIKFALSMLCTVIIVTVLEIQS